MSHQKTPVHVTGPEPPAVDPKTRQALLRLLASIPSVVEAMRTATAGQMFRAVMSEKNAHLLKQAADGYYKPYLREAGHFVENVNLEAVSPDYAKSVANLSLNMTLAAIVAKLDAIQAGIRDLADHQKDMVRRETLGTLDALASAAAITDPVERRHHMLGRCLDVETALGKLAGQLRTHARAMPSPEAGWPSRLFSDPIAKASGAVADVVEVGWWVESRKGAVFRLCRSRFPSPLIKPDVPISGIRLSDWLRLRHTAAHQGEPGEAEARRVCRTPLPQGNG